MYPKFYALFLKAPKSNISIDVIVSDKDVGNHSTPLGAGYKSRRAF
jgi:hypothetical protein